MLVPGRGRVWIWQVRGAKSRCLAFQAVKAAVLDGADKGNVQVWMVCTSVWLYWCLWQPRLLREELGEDFVLGLMPLSSSAELSG